MAELNEKRVKACIKEGGKKGVDLQGTTALGGISFFNISMDEPAGELAYLEKALEGANAEVDEAAEERKGGAGDLGKVFLSAGVATLAVIGHLPKALAEAKGVKLADWMSAVLAPVGYTVGTKPGESIVSDAEYCRVVIVADKDAGKFPLKMRDELINGGVNFLKERQLLPAGGDDDDDEYVDNDTEW